jgi:hypothetical protein
MLRVVLYVTLLSVLFVGAVLSAGNAIGAWEPAFPPLSTTTVNETGKKAQHKHHQKAAAKRAKEHG